MIQREVLSILWNWQFCYNNSMFPLFLFYNIQNLAYLDDQKTNTEINAMVFYIYFQPKYLLV